ncbi:Putative porin [Flexibacter flexilis DSM 6793]|uniref:Putative porin n=1 Tax=Flexibacter flexilis DSM 6793 TaxID=927664 RepID=A0A1I1LFX1_9BACT|nr:Putative porin [Flexibacter flexilis DSM 6793]
MPSLCKFALVKKKLLILSFSLWACQQGFAQIVDDTTHQKYGPQTVRYFLEKEIYENKRVLHTLDTTLRDVHNTDDFLYSDQNSFRPNKNLGNWGSAIQSQYFALPKQIGTNYGVDVFTPYALDAGAARYFNTFSPYTYAHYYQGGFGRQMLKAGFNRNFTTRFNFGFDYRRITSQKQIGVTKNRDPEASQHAGLVYASYVSKNGKYVFLGNYSHLNQYTYETGGVKPAQEDFVDGQLDKDKLFDYKIEQINLSATAHNRDLRNKWHIYQQYTLDNQDAVQLFYLFERSRQTNRYTDPSVDSSQIYGAGIYDSSATFQQQIYTLWEQRGGIKGKLGGAAHYAVYFRRKDFTLNSLFPIAQTLKNENFVGGQLRYHLPADSTYFVSVDAEMQPSRDYWAKVLLHTDLVEAGAEQMRYAPTMVQRYYNGNHFVWENPNFEYTDATHLWGNANLKLGKKMVIKPMAEFTTLKNYIYYGTDAKAHQVGKDTTIKVLAAGTELNLTLGKWHLNHLFRYTKTSGADVIRMPDKYAQLRYYYESPMFKSALLVQVGLDMRWRSSYYADAYMPATQQFRLQNDFLVSPYMVTDLFVNMRIKRVQIFFKLNNITQGIGGKGYFAAPYYPGTRRMLDFGLIWQFFD